MRPVEVQCEEERLRRLAEAMCRDGEEGAEPARQRRAQSFSQGIAALEDKLAMGAARRSQAVQALEAGLDARRRAVVEDMAAADSRHSSQPAGTGSTPREAVVSTTSPVLQADKARAEERQNAKSLLSESSERIDVRERLSDALDQITVRSVVSFRALLKVPVAVEAVTVAVLRLSSTGERVGNGDTAAPVPRNWEDARKVLLKPGHFVNALRRYAYTAEQGHVMESDRHHAEETLADVQANGEVLAEVHETAGQLHEWLRAAVDYAVLTCARPQDIASPARAMRSQLTPARNPEAVVSAPVTPLTDVGGRLAADSSSSGGYPPQQQERQRQPQPKSLAAGPSSTRSPSPKLLRRPPGSSGTAAAGSTAQATFAAATGAATAAARPGGFTKSSSGYNLSSAAPKPEASAGSSTAATLSASRLARSSVAGVSPRRRASASPPPATAFAMSHSKHTSTSSSSRAPAGTSKSANLSTSASGTSNSFSSARPTRHSVGAASPLPAKKQAATAQASRVERPNGSPLAVRSSSAIREKPGTSSGRRHSTVVAAGSSTTAVARAVSANGHAVAVSARDASGIPVGQLVPSPEDYASMRTKLEQEKKEIKQMRALESQLKWNMDREERRQTAEERQEEARQIMEWREEQAKDMKEYVEEKAREQRIQDLLESKDYQHFKREWKQAVRLEEIEHIKEQLEKGMDNAHWQIELQKALALDRQLALQEKFEASEELRELKEKERVREKASQENERAHELALDFAFQANQISAEKEELLRNLALMRQQQRQPTRSGGSGFWPGGRRQ